MRLARARRFARWMPVLLDVAVVTGFVVVGRRSHDEVDGFAGFLEAWWPFAVGLGTAALVTGAWRKPLGWVPATGAWLGTVVVGMTLRVGVQGRDLRPSFVIVATLVLGAGMLGWRAAARWSLARQVKARSPGG